MCQSGRPELLPEARGMVVAGQSLFHSELPRGRYLQPGRNRDLPPCGDDVLAADENSGSARLLPDPSLVAGAGFE